MVSVNMGIVQRHDPDRFACLLFAPEAARETLAVLYAFNHEIARAREVASQPVLALIRLQWWREVVEGADRAHPVAQALLRMVATGRLSGAALGRMIDARMLEAETALSEAAWFAYLEGAGGALMQEAGRVLAVDVAAEVLLTAGCGVAAAGLLRNRAAHAAQGRTSFPVGRDAAWVGAQARRLLGAPRLWPESVVAAALPVFLARRWLGRRAGDEARPTGWVDRAGLWLAARRRYF